MKRRWRFVLIQLSGWSLYGFVHYAATLPAVTDAERWHMAGWKAVRALTGLGVSSLLPIVYRRVGTLERLWTTILTVLITATVAGLFWFVADRTTLVTLLALTPLQVNWNRFPRGFELDYVFVLLAWSGAYVAAHYWDLAERRRREALEQRVLTRDAQLSALMFQLSPHFLFNTLNSIRSLVSEDAERARLMISRLAAFLRYTLSAPSTTTVAQEIEAMRAYLSIEQARFEDRLLGDGPRRTRRRAVPYCWPDPSAPR